METQCNTTDQVALIRATQHGNMQAFTDLVLRCEPTLCRVARRIVGDADAMDVVQDALLAAYCRISSFSGRSFEAWLVRIVINCAYMFLRSAKRSHEGFVGSQADAASYAPAAREPEAWMCRSEVWQALATGLRMLPPEQRLIVVLRDVHGLSYEEIAAAAHIPVGTVRSRLSRGRAGMRYYIMAHRELFPPQ